MSTALVPQELLIVPAAMPLGEALGRLCQVSSANGGIGCIGIGSPDRVSGLLTEADAVALLLLNQTGSAVESSGSLEVPVGDVVSPVRAVLSLADLQHDEVVADRLRQEPYLLVQDDRGHCQGIITPASLLKTLPHWVPKASFQREQQQRERVEVALRHRRQFETLLVQLITLCINLELDEIDQGLSSALEKITHFFGVDRSAIRLLVDEEQIVETTHYWESEDLSGGSRATDPVAIADLRWWMDRLQQDQVIQTHDVACLPPEADPEKSRLQAAGMQTVVAVPILYNASLVGFIELSARHQLSTWPEDATTLIQVVGAIFVDTLTRQRSGLALRRSIQTNRALLDALPDLMFRINQQGDFINYKAAAESQPEINAQSFLGKNVQEVLPPSIAQQALYAIQRALKTGQIQIFECQLPIQETYYDWEVRVVVSDEAEAMAIVRDITERKQAEAALRTAKEQLQAVLDTVPALVSWIDSDLRYLGVNRQLANAFSRHPEDFTGKPVGFLELSSEFNDFVGQFFSSYAMTDRREVMLDIAGYRRNYLIIAQKYARREVAVFVGVDITERKQSEENIHRTLAKERELNELKSRFISMASHEFRTPLTTILVSSELMRQYYSRLSEEKREKYHHRIHSAIQRMTRLIDDVLIIGQAESGRLTCNPVPIDLPQYCRNLVEELQISEEYQGRIVLRLPEPVGDNRSNRVVYLDERLLRQILTNLLSNAVKYSPAGSPVLFQLTLRATRAIFQVQDQGIGIPPEDLTHLFESFHRAKNVGNIQGTGLGLAIVKKAVDLHNGEISVNSALGEGTRFTVSLPLQEPTI